MPSPKKPRAKRPATAPAAPPKPAAPEAPVPPDVVTCIDPALDMTFFEFLSAQGGEGFDPLSDEALRLQALYVQQVGWHPLDTLRQVMTSPWHNGAARVAAARAILEYSARKPAAKTETNLEAKFAGQSLTLDAAVLAKLSDAELAVLEKLLMKIGAV